MARLGLLSGRMRVALVCGVTGSGLLFGGLPAATAAEQPPTDTPAPVVATESGPSEDTAAISEAADNYDAGDPAGAAALADAAAAADAVPMVEAATGAATTVTEAGTVHVDTDGAITLTAADGPQIGIDLNATASNVEFVDGAVVATGVAPATDMVTRATEAGVQVVAVLGDESAPNEVAFPINLPEDTELVEQADGSLNIVVSEQVAVADPADTARFDAEVSAVLAGTDDPENLTDEQWARLDAIDPVAVTTETVVTTVGSIEPAWAVDANGQPLRTSYEFDGNSLTQIIETDADTAYPITADPSVAFWKKAAQCAGQLGLLALGTIAGGAKAIQMAVKFAKYVKALPASSAVYKAWKVFKTSGVSDAQAFVKLAKAMYSLMKKLVQSGKDAMISYANSTASLKAAFTIMTFAGAKLAEIIGINHCIDLATKKY